LFAHSTDLFTPVATFQHLSVVTRTMPTVQCCVVIKV